MRRSLRNQVHDNGKAEPFRTSGGKAAILGAFPHIRRKAAILGAFPPSGGKAAILEALQHQAAQPSGVSEFCIYLIRKFGAMTKKWRLGAIQPP